MNDVYTDLLKEYLWSITNLDKNILFVYDKSGLMNNIDKIDIKLCPHKVIKINENVVFRSQYENIKHEKDERYLLVLKNKDIKHKLSDFIKRSEKEEIKTIDTKNFLDSIEEKQFKWNETINDFHIEDLLKRINELIYYRKLFRKKNVEKNEVDKIVVSALLDFDATQINDEVDCYLYYKELVEIYNNFESFGYETDIKKLLISFFSNYGQWVANAIENNIFDKFDKFIWISAALNEINKLSIENIKKVIGKDTEELSYFKEHLDEVIRFTKLIDKKNKKLYVQSKDRAEKSVYRSGIDIYESEKDYRAIIREGNGNYISIVESIRTLLKGFNLEGIKKVFKYNINDLIELKVLIDESSIFITENTDNIKRLFNTIIELFKNIEYVEQQIKYVGEDHSEWEVLYKNYLYNLQYKFSEIKYLDNQDIIESNRYEIIDNRINKILNKYRKRFAQFVEKNYEIWRERDYGISRPVLNSDIEGLLDLEDHKTFIIVFDGMRYDAWENIVKPYFLNLLGQRNTKYKTSYSLLPSITSVSRGAIYDDILKRFKDDSNYMVKSESAKNENLLKESILEDKKVNVLVFNMFDRDGHKATDDFYTFYDKQKKVFESNIGQLLNTIPENANIVITSDHGLMRIDENINMKDEELVTEVKTRYLTLDNGSSDIEKEGFINIENYLLSYDNKGYFLGGGEKDYYSHGGASIEEMIVPLIISETKVSKNEAQKTKNRSSIYLQDEDLRLDDDTVISLSFKVSEREKIILTSLYNFKNQNVSNRDIEKILKNKTGNSGLVDGEIRRLIRKLKKDELDIIEVSSAGDLIIYKLNEKGLKGEI